MEEEAKYIRSLSKGVTTSKNQDIALKATKKQKGKSVIEESSSGESEKAQALMRRIWHSSPKASKKYEKA